MLCILEFLLLPRAFSVDSARARCEIVAREERDESEQSTRYRRACLRVANFRRKWSKLGERVKRGIRTNNCKPTLPASHIFPSGKSENPALASTEGASFLRSSPNMTTEWKLVTNCCQGGGCGATAFKSYSHSQNITYAIDLVTQNIYFLGCSSFFSQLSRLVLNFRQGITSLIFVSILISVNL